MTAADPAKKLAALVKRLRTRFPGAAVAPVDQVLPRPVERPMAEDPGDAVPVVAARAGAVLDDAAGLAAVAELALEMGEDVEDAEIDGPQEPVIPVRPSGKSKTPAVARIEVGVDSLTRELLYSLLLWESNSVQSLAALKRIEEFVVDYNELRVSLVDEIVGVLGAKYPFGAERAARVRATLTDIFKRQHSLRLGHLRELGKREATAYLRSLEGTPPFAAARVAMLCLDAHTIPVDQRLVGLLRQEKVSGADDDVHTVESWLSHQVSAGDAREVAALLQRWSDEDGVTPKRQSLVGEEIPIVDGDAAPAAGAAPKAVKSPESKGAAGKKVKPAKPEAARTRTAKSRDRAANPSKPRNSG